MRERGLKLEENELIEEKENCRSREGAWIEISITVFTVQVDCRRSREGAWIEIITLLKLRWSQSVAPVRERGLKSCNYSNVIKANVVAPVRERGLK